jgi:hypothetical protein
MRLNSFLFAFQVFSLHRPDKSSSLAQQNPAPLTPSRTSRLRAPELGELQISAVRGLFNHQHGEQGLTSNWFRALSLNEGDLERLNGYLLRYWAPTAGAD